MKRIVYTLAVGSPKFARMALGLGRSLRFLGDSTERVVVTDQMSQPWRPSFDQVLPWQAHLENIFFEKLSALDRTDADQVLYVDGDCLAFRRLGEIFNYCQGKGLCVQGYPVTSGDWYGDVAGHLKRHEVPFLPKFNGGMIYFERTSQCLRLIDQIREMRPRVADLGFGRDDQLLPDEPVIALAMAKSGLGSLIPETMDFTNSATGLVGKLTLDVANNDCHFVARRNDLRFVRPYLFHASRYSKFAIYWRQLAYLEKMERYEKEHEFGYMSFSHKLRRSVERRLLKWTGKI